MVFLTWIQKFGCGSNGQGYNRTIVYESKRQQTLSYKRQQTCISVLFGINTDRALIIDKSLYNSRITPWTILIENSDTNRWGQWHYSGPCPDYHGRRQYLSWGPKWAAYWQSSFFAYPVLAVGPAKSVPAWYFLETTSSNLARDLGHGRCPLELCLLAAIVAPARRRVQ